MLSTTRNRDGQSGERGQVLVLFAGGLVALLLIAALAFDVGMVLLERRDEQNAADAAALAGARFVLTSETDAETAARRIARLNGFDDADPSEVVNVFIPAVHGRYAGLPGFIEVQIENTRPSIFAGVIGRAVWPVGAYAVATNKQNLSFPFSMLALAPTYCKAIQVSGTGEIDAWANIQSNSSGADCSTEVPPTIGIGFSRTGGATIQVHADDATCRVVGLLQDQGSGPPLECTVAERSFALPDPLRNLPAPDLRAVAPPLQFAGTTTPAPAIPKNCPGGSPAPTEAGPLRCKLSPTGGYANTKWILSPGLYPGGIEVNNGTTAYLLPGVYWIGGGGFRTTTGGSVISVASVADAMAPIPVWGGGVLIYNSKLPLAADGDISLGGSGATLKLKALDLPETDPEAIYNNIVIFQDRTVTQTVTLNGSASNSEVTGIIYVPAGPVKLNGNGGTLTVDQIIAYRYLIDGNGGHISVLRRTGVDAIIVAAGLVD